MRALREPSSRSHACVPGRSARPWSKDSWFEKGFGVPLGQNFRDNRLATADRATQSLPGDPGKQVASLIRRHAVQLAHRAGA
jgi:hypothetical protein